MFTGYYFDTFIVLLLMVHNVELDLWREESAICCMTGFAFLKSFFFFNSFVRFQEKERFLYHF